MNFSGHILLPHLKLLQHQFLASTEEDDEKYRSAYFDLELLPYALGGTWYALAELARIQNEIISKYPPERLEGLVFFGLPNEDRDLLSYMVDNFLDAARRAQNSVIHYLSRGLRMSLPSSMSTLIKQMEAGRIQLPALPHEQMLVYWANNGRLIKDYRDLAQHHALVTSDARLIRSADGRVGIYLLLPSNPGVKQAGKLTFNEPEVHAFPFALHQFKVLIFFLGWLTRGLVSRRPEDRMQSVIHLFRNYAELGPGVVYTAHVPPSADKLQETIDAFLQQVRESGG